jgi:hypothetical protein
VRIKGGGGGRGRIEQNFPRVPALTRLELLPCQILTVRKGENKTSTSLTPLTSWVRGPRGGKLRGVPLSSLAPAAGFQLPQGLTLFGLPGGRPRVAWGLVRPAPKSLGVWVRGGESPPPRPGSCISSAVQPLGRGGRVGGAGRLQQHGPGDVLSLWARVIR